MAEVFRKEKLDGLLDSIKKAAEAQRAASASAVEKAPAPTKLKQTAPQEQKSPYNRVIEQIRAAAEAQKAGAETAQGTERRPNAHSETTRHLYAQAERGPSERTESALENIYAAAGKRETGLADSPYAEILRRGDYARNSRAGESRLGLGAETDRTYDYINDINGFRARADEQAVMSNDAQRLGKYGLMTGDEIGVYNYLYSTRGREAAEGYLTELETELNRQYYSGLKKSTLEDVSDGRAGLSGNEIAASAITALQQPVRSVNSALANLEDAYRTATGQGIDPYSQHRTASRLTQDVREEISGDMGDVGQFAYNTVMSALDSTVNALVAQGVGESLGFGGNLTSPEDVERLKKAVNVIGSLTMSSEVMSMAVAESKEKNYSDIGALSLGLTRGAIEYLSEKWGGDWIINKAKGNPTSLLYALKTAMIPEGTEEVMSDAMNEVVNNIIDPIFGTEESYIRKAYQYWKDQGAGNGKALSMTLLTVLQQEILSFAGGAFAAAGSGTTNYRSNTMAFNDTAGRLNTDVEGVVRLMRDIGAEDVFQVAELAQLYGANSAEQLEAKVKEVGGAAAAVDAGMRTQAAGNADDAQDDAGERATARVAPTGTETTGQQTETAAAGQVENDTARIDNENAPAGTAEAVKSAAQTGQEGRASIETLPDGRKYVKADREVIMGNDPDSWGDQITEYINGKIRNGEDVPVVTMDGDTLLLTKDTAGKAAFRNYVEDGSGHGRVMTDDEYYAKVNAEAHIDELVGASEMNDRGKPPVPDRGGLHDFAKDGWKYRTVYFRDFDGRYYRITLSTGLANGDYTVYNVGEMKEAPFPTFSGSDSGKAARAGKETSSDPINTSNHEQSQEEKTPMQRAMEDALRRKGESYEELFDNGSEDGNADQRAGGQAGAEADQADAGAGSRSQGEISQGVSEAGGPDLRNSREVTPAALGIANGSETDTVTVLDIDRQDENVRGAADQVRKAGMEPVAFAGEMKINGVSVNGYIMDGKVYFRSDGNVDSDSIVKHELFHGAADADPEIVAAANDIIRRKISREAFLQMEQDYYEAYKDLYAWESMDDEAVMNRIHEEIGADAYAGMNRFSQGSQIARAVREDLAARVQQQTTGTKETGGRTTETPYELTYQGLIQKNPMAVTVLEEDADIAGGKKRGDILNKAIENVRGKNNPHNTEEHQFIRVNDTGYDLRITRDGLRHGIAKLTNRSGKTTAAVTQKIGDILTNAIKVNEMNRRDGDPSNVNRKDVLLGYAEDDQRGYVVRAIATVFDEAADLQDWEAYPLLATVKAKKVDSPIVHTTSAETGRGQDPQATYSISIQQLLDLVKEQYPDILSDDALEAVGSSREEAMRMDGSLKGQMRYSADVPEGRTAEEIRKEIRQAENEYMEHADAGDEEYDFKAQMEKIKALRAEAEEAEVRERETGERSIADSREDNKDARNDNTAKKAEDNNDPEAAKENLLAFGTAGVKNDTGEYRMKLRMKRDGRYLVSVDVDGKRSQARTFANEEAAAEWAAGYVNGVTKAREDAALDRHKSKKERAPTITEALFGQVDPKKEADRRLRNSAADAETQTLRGRIRRANDEIQALNRLEKTTGLTEQQKAHREDLQKTLEIMTNELESRKAKTAEERKAQAERKKAERVEFTGNKPTQSVTDARAEIMNLFHTPDGVRKETGAAIEQRLKEMLETGRVTEESRQALFDTLVDAGMVPKAADPTFREIRNDLNGRRIFVSEKERSDFGDNWKSVYQKAWGARIFLTSDPTDVKLDAVNQELADVYGESLFPTDAALSDMLDNMIDLAGKGRDTQQSLKGAIAEEAHFSGVTEDQIYQEMAGKLDEQLRTFGKKAGLEVMLKNKAASDAATERKRWEERQERKAQERRESKIREKVLHGLQRLEKLRGKAAPDVRAQVDEVLKDIDTQARSLTPYGIENLKALQEAYEEKARQEGFIDDENPGNFIRNPYVEEQLKRLSDKHLNEMDIADVIALGKAVAGLEQTIRTANQMIGDEFDATVKETAEGVDREVKASKGAKAGFLQKWFKEEQLSPRRFLDMLGGWKDGTMKKLSASLENGQTRMLDFQRRAVQSFDPFMSKKENREWLKTASGKKAAWSSYGVVNGMAMDGSGYTGQSIEITPMMKIALYLHSLNNDNLRHIQTGGIVVPNKALYQKGKIQEAYAQGQRVKMQPEAVRAIASTLTAQEKTFAGYLQKFFNEQSKAAINEVSMQLDGFERAGVDNYFPIETDASFNKSDVAGEARAQTVEGIGSIANERVHAGNPIRLCDASDVLMRQIDKVSRYYGYAIPIRNFQAVNNYVFHEEGNAYAGSIKDTINRKWGSGAGQYITKMLADLQSGGSSRSDAMSRALSGLRSNLAGATLTLNPSVAVSQAASYPGAAQVVGWDGLAAGLTGKVDEKLIEKYTPLLWYRSQGYSTQELGDAKSAANQNLAQKALTNKWLNWIQGMDRLTVKRLWAAAEYRVRKDTGMKPGSKAQIDAGTDPYYKAVAEVFNRAVYDTQPNYTNMERAQILRSDSDLTKFLTMYKTVPLQYYGMMTEAAGRLQAARNGTAQEKAAARKYAADTFGGLMAANTVYAAIKALFKGFRKKDDAYRDDEGELTAESVSKQLGKDLLEIYAGSVIGGAEAYSAAQYLFKGGRYNAPELNIMSYGEDFIKGLRSVYSALDDDDPRKAAKAVKDAALTISQGMGLPVKNVETYLMAGVRWVRPDLALEYDNTFGGLDKSDLRGMDAETAGMATNIILRNRTGEILDRSVTDELARLYREGYREAVPTAIPDSFTYAGTTVEIKDRKAYSETWGGIVGDNLEDLLGSNEYADADDKARKGMIDRLYDYATVQARKGAEPGYSVTGNSTYGWTEKADEALKAGISLTTSICAMIELNGMFADKDENGKSITGSRKEKVVEYIDALDLTDEQKDFVYLNFGGYTESSIHYTPWHGYDGAYRKTSTGGRRGGRRGGGRSGGRNASKETKAVAVPTVKKSSSGVDISRLFGGVQKTDLSGADASKRLLEIIDKHYGGDAFAAAMDGGRKARTKVDFKL